MKKASILLFCTIICCTLANSQSLIEKSFFTKNRTLGGDAVITRSVQEVKEKKAFTSFEVDIPSAGNYYANFWLCPAKSPNGVFYEYDVLVNDKMIGKIIPTHGDWQSISINDKEGIELVAGKCTISVVGTIPDLPSVEFVRLSKNSESAQIDGSAYEDYKKEISKISVSQPNQTESRVFHDIDTIADTRNIFPLPPQTNPPYDAYFVINAPVRYTFYKTVYLQAGMTTISTQGISNFPHVVEVFNSASPTTYAWSKKSNDSYQVNLNFIVLSPGIYYVKVRSYNNATSGLCNLNINGTYIYNEIPVYNYSLKRDKDIYHIYNSFTCYSNGDPRLWVEEGASPGRVTAFNDDYSDCSDYDWDLNARVIKQYTSNSNTIHLSSGSSASPTTVCDIYTNCLSSSIVSNSTNFIQSAPDTPIYNCIAWSGGIYSAHIWPPSVFSSITSDPLCAFDLFYSMERYPGCSRFTRTNPATHDYDVVLWANGNYNGYPNYTHASVKKGADNNAHGFCWESKCGSDIRVYHPEGVSMSNYGQVVEYYKRIDSNSSGSLTLEEAIANGDAVMENVQFTSDEENYLVAKLSAIEIGDMTQFEILYEKWSQIWNNTVYSNPDQIADCDEYRELLSLCKTNDNLKFAIFKKLGAGDVCATCLVKDLTLQSKENKEKLKQIIVEKTKCGKTDSGATIVYTIISNAMSYVKELLAEEMSKNNMTRSAGMTTGISYSNTDLFNLSVTSGSLDISFKLCETSRVSVDIMDLQGKIVAQLINQPSMKAKTYNYQCVLPKGLYLVRYIINGNVNVKKVCIE